MSNLSLAEKFKLIREAKGLSQEAFGKEIHVTGSFISGIESGKKTPSALVMESVVSKFNVSLDWWETGDGAMFAGHKKQPHHEDMARQFEKEMFDLLDMLGDDAQRLDLMSEFYRFCADQKRRLKPPSL